ncbi:MAG: DALR anticodon-binding domain-containing protein, partial [Streptosporangiaceae bacterium]
STILAGTATAVPPWPDLAAAPDWRHAWQDHATAMTGRLAAAAGAQTIIITTGERPGSGANALGTRRPTVAAALGWYGVPVVRYGLARTAPGQVAQLDRVLQPGAYGTDPLYPVQHAETSAASVLRWAADLGRSVDDPGEQAGELLRSPAERALLGMLLWLPVRVAAAARRHRPDELPGYLEAVAAAWLLVRQVAPALPFGGHAAPADRALAAARLLLASAVRAVLASGLALTGGSVCAGDD